MGKTTLLKMEVRRLVREGVRPDRILYFSFDSEVQPSDMYAVVEEYFAMHGSHGRRFLFFDEITSVRNWHKAVKNMLDNGMLGGCTLAMTGSQAAGVIGHAGHLAGRRGVPESGALDRVLDPMSFGEYVAARDPGIRAEMGRLSLDSERDRINAVRAMIAGELPVPARSLLQFKAELDAHLRSYLLAGGMPRTANELAAAGSLRDETYRDHKSMVRSDAADAGLRYEWASRVLRAAAASVGSPVSWASLKDSAGMKSHRTVEEYGARLSDLFVLYVVHRYNSSEDAPKRNALKKVYFRDPFFFNAWAARDAEDAFAQSAATVDAGPGSGRVVEQAAAGHVMRLASAMAGRADPFEYQDDVFYWKSRRGREVDFVMRAAGAAVPIEVKWQGRVRRDDMQGIFDFRKASGADGRDSPQQGRCARAGGAGCSPCRPVHAARVGPAPARRLAGGRPVRDPAFWMVGGRGARMCRPARCPVFGRCLVSLRRRQSNALRMTNQESADGQNSGVLPTAWARCRPWLVQDLPRNDSYDSPATALP